MSGCNRFIPWLLYSAIIAPAFGMVGARAADPPATGGPAANQPVLLISADEAAAALNSQKPPYMPATLNRQVVRFDFEEASLVPIPMPRYFYRYGGTTEHIVDGLSPGGSSTGARAEGFPPFGEIRLTNEHATSGAWSFGFSLEGGSLSSRVPTHVIPVMPGATYEIAAAVRTEGLSHARARLVGWLHDSNGNLIEGTHVTSEPIRTRGEWGRHAFRVPAAPDNAAGMVIELQLVQPRHWQSTVATDGRPALEDVHGRAWFDELTVTLLPQISCTVGGGYEPGVVRLPNQPVARLAVADAARAPLHALLEVFDLSDNRVFSHETTVSQQSGDVVIPIDIDRAGWYRLELQVSDDGVPLEHVMRSFVILAMDDDDADKFGESPLVAVNHVDSRNDGVTAAVAKFAAIMAANDVVCRLDSMQIDPANRESAIDGLIREVDALGRATRASSVWLTGFDFPTARENDRQLDRLLIHHGLHAERWIVEQAGGDNESLARMTSAADVVEVASIDDDPYGSGVRRRLIVRIPATWPITQIWPSLEPWLANHTVEAVLLEQDDAQSVPARQRVADMTTRALATWAAGAGDVMVNRPWTVLDGLAEPTPLLLPWAMLGRHLGGRTLLADLSPNEHTHCWLIGTAADESAALLVWSDRAGESSEEIISLCVGDGALQLMDLAGNVTPLNRRGRRTEIPLANLPAIIEGVDRNILQFQSMSAINPSTLQPVPSIQEATLRLGNPWSRQITGSVRIVGRDDLEFMPRELEFAMEPGEQVHLPITVLPTHRVLAGNRTVQLNVSLSGARTTTIEVDVPLKIGVDDVSMTAGWQLARSDTGESFIEINASVSNRGESERQLALVVLTADGDMSRRAIPSLAAGDTVVVRVALPASRLSPAGETIRVGLADRITGAQLNTLLRIERLRGLAGSMSTNSPD